MLTDEKAVSRFGEDHESPSVVAVTDLYSQMREKLQEVVPDFELRYKVQLAEEVLELKRELGALILGHNYMEPALFHSIPDYTGDSLELCRKAAQTDNDPIVFCGVRFMAETAKILNPDKTVLLPSMDAGCSLAASITAEDVLWLRNQFPGVPVVCYINTNADVKAESDVCCTSANAAAVVESLESDSVILLPDEYLARNVAQETGKKVISPAGNGANHSGEYRNAVMTWHGKCEVHERFTVEDVERVRAQFPGVVVLAHPECSPEVVQASDFTGSTTGLVKYVQNSDAKSYLLLTECSMGDNIAADNPDKEMVRLCAVRCPHMNEITLEQTLAALLQNRYQIELPTVTMDRARRAIERMLEIG